MSVLAPIFPSRLALLLVLGTAIIYGGAQLLHDAHPAKNNPAGGITSLADGTFALTLLGSVAAAIVGATAAAGDLESGVYRDLVVTGRSRVALYARGFPPVSASCSRSLPPRMGSPPPRASSLQTDARRRRVPCWPRAAQVVEADLEEQPAARSRARAPRPARDRRHRPARAADRYLPRNRARGSPCMDGSASPRRRSPRQRPRRLTH